MVTEVGNVSRVIRKQQLYASVIRACPHCGAPGFWHDTPGVNPGCYAPEKVTRIGEDFVGTVCPNCGKDRPGIEQRGKIWEKIWRVGLWTVIADIFREFWQSFKRRLAT